MFLPIGDYTAVLEGFRMLPEACLEAYSMHFVLHLEGSRRFQGACLKGVNAGIYCTQLGMQVLQVQEMDDC